MINVGLTVVFVKKQSTLLDSGEQSFASIRYFQQQDNVQTKTGLSNAFR